MFDFERAFKESIIGLPEDGDFVRYQMEQEFFGFDKKEDRVQNGINSFNSLNDKHGHNRFK